MARRVPHKHLKVSSILSSDTLSEYSTRMWATKYIEQLQSGVTVKFRPHGNSMNPRIKNGELVTVTPMDRAPQVGDMVLCKVDGRQWLHLVTAVCADGDGCCQISNNHGHTNGWCSLKNVFGRVIGVEP